MNSIKRTRYLAALAGCCLCAFQPTFAAPVVPAFDIFGPLPEATFGGAGIDNNNVAITTITDASNTITLGLTATPRFSNPPLSNDGAGTFTAMNGINDGLVGSPTLGARWNFNYFIKIVGGGTFADYAFDLFYDFDPGTGTDESVLGRIDFDLAIPFAPGAPMPSAVSQIEDSQNLNFGFLAGPLPFLTPPVFAPFNGNVNGEYSFLLTVNNLSRSSEIGRSAILVNVVPEPGSLALLGAGIFLIGMRRKVKH